MSSLRTDVNATADAVFWCTSVPRRALPLMMQYGTSFLRQSAGNQITISRGSTSCAITTSLACLLSMRDVTWLRPYLSMSGFLLSTWPPPSSAFAMARRRCFFASFVSGLYFFKRRRSWPAWFLSIAELNWLTAGGDLRRLSRMAFFRCSVTYLGHLTTRERFTRGWIAPPMRKLRGVFSKSGFFFVFFASFWRIAGAAATFFFFCCFGAMDELRRAS